MLTALLTAAKAAILTLLLGVPGTLLANVHAIPVPVRYGFVPLFVDQATGQGQVLGSVPTTFVAGAQAPLTIATGSFAGKVSLAATQGLTLTPAAPAEVWNGTTRTETLTGTTLDVASVSDGTSALWYVSAQAPGTYPLTISANGVSRTVKIHIVSAPLGSMIVGTNGARVVRGAAQVVPVMNQRMLQLSVLGL